MEAYDVSDLLIFEVQNLKELWFQDLHWIPVQNGQSTCLFYTFLLTKSPIEIDETDNEDVLHLWNPKRN